MKLDRAAVGFAWIVLAIAAGAHHTLAREGSDVVKIGVYDSRGIAIAWARSQGFNAEMAKLHSDLEAAKASGDAEEAAKLEEEGRSTQVRLHLRGFSTAGAGDLLAKVADRIPAVASEAGVALIVSKWELPYRDSEVELVDVTLPLARLFGPDDKTLAILGELAGQPPVPFDELSLDPAY